MSVVTRIRRSETLSVPFTPKEVWAILTDVAAYSDWWPSTPSLRILNAPPGLLRTEWEVRPLVGRVVRFRLEELEGCRNLRLRFFDGALEGPGGFHLTPTGDATRVTYAVDVFARGLDVAALSRVLPLDAMYGLRMRRVLRSLSRRLRGERKRVERSALEVASLAAPEAARFRAERGPEQAMDRAVEGQTARVADVRVLDEAAAQPDALESAAFDIGGVRARVEEVRPAPGTMGSRIRDVGTGVARWLMDSPRSRSGPEPDSVKPSAPVTEPRPNFEIARGYLDALSTAADPSELIPFLEPYMVGEEFPNLALAAGAIRDRDAILSAWSKSREMWIDQRFDLLGATGGGSQVAMEVRWTATSAGGTDHFRMGQPVEATLALFLKFKDQRIVRQRAYFCFGPAILEQGPQGANSEDEMACADRACPPSAVAAQSRDSSFDIARSCSGTMSTGGEGIDLFPAMDATQEEVPAE